MAPATVQDDVPSMIDTDLYKLTMQCVIHALYPDVHVTYGFNNRTPDLKLNRKAFEWLQQRVSDLSKCRLTDDELHYLRRQCKYLDHGDYFDFLSSFRFRPSEHVSLQFTPEASGSDHGVLHITISGLWVDTILYEIPLLALTSEAYFKHVDTSWTHSGQRSGARQKGLELLRANCVFSEFGTRRRRDYHTQELVMQGLQDAAKELDGSTSGKFTGTSNVHFAHRFGVMPVGTVAHEWFMGVAAYTGDYVHATETALQGWMECFGRGILSIALTDTFGTPVFLNSFAKTVPPDGMKALGGWADASQHRYADAFAGVRQDSGDPRQFIKTMGEFYRREQISETKSVVFSDSLNVRKCLEYKELAEKEGFAPSFGIGTFLTNDFRKTDGEKSVPMNIVIKLSSADGRPAIKLSDDLGKHTGDEETVKRVKEQLGYVDKHWEGAEESKRWDSKA